MDETTNRPRTFGDWLLHQARAAGYQIPHRGEQARLQRDSGISHTSLVRLLSNQGTPQIDSLRQIADFFHKPLPEVLIAAGWLTPSDIDRARTRPARDTPITTGEALDELGITDPTDRHTVEAVIETVKRHRTSNRGDSERTAE